MFLKIFRFKQKFGIIRWTFSIVGLGTFVNIHVYSLSNIVFTC